LHLKCVLAFYSFLANLLQFLEEEDEDFSEKDDKGPQRRSSRIKKNKKTAPVEEGVCNDN